MIKWGKSLSLGGGLQISTQNIQLIFYSSKKKIRNLLKVVDANASVKLN